MALIAVFASAVAMFKFQNLDVATVTLWSMSLTLPMSVLVLLIYGLGMLTDGFVLALLRSWIRGARQPSP